MLRHLIIVIIAFLWTSSQSSPSANNLQNVLSIFSDHDQMSSTITSVSSSFLEHDLLVEPDLCEVLNQVGDENQETQRYVSIPTSFDLVSLPVQLRQNVAYSLMIERIDCVVIFVILNTNHLYSYLISSKMQNAHLFGPCHLDEGNEVRLEYLESISGLPGMQFLNIMLMNIQGIVCSRKIDIIQLLRDAITSKEISKKISINTVLKRVSYLEDSCSISIVEGESEVAILLSDAKWKYSFFLRFNFSTRNVTVQVTGSGLQIANNGAVPMSTGTVAADFTDLVYEIANHPFILNTLDNMVAEIMSSFASPLKLIVTKNESVNIFPREEQLVVTRLLAHDHMEIAVSPSGFVQYLLYLMTKPYDDVINCALNQISIYKCKTICDRDAIAVSYAGLFAAKLFLAEGKVYCILKTVSSGQKAFLISKTEGVNLRVADCRLFSGSQYHDAIRRCFNKIDMNRLKLRILKNDIPKHFPKLKPALLSEMIEFIKNVRTSAQNFQPDFFIDVDTCVNVNFPLLAIEFSFRRCSETSLQISVHSNTANETALGITVNLDSDLLTAI